MVEGPAWAGRSASASDLLGFSHTTVYREQLKKKKKPETPC